MGLLRWLKSKRQANIQNLSFDEFLDMLAGGGKAKSGASVNWQTALQCVTAFACARAIANGIAQVPFKLFQKNEKGRNPANDHYLYDLLTFSPNEWQTSFDFRFQIALHLVFCGNAFVFLNRGPGGRILELLAYEPQVVTVHRDGWELSYEIDVGDGRKITIEAADMWHIRGPSWNGWMGMEGVRLAREAIGLAMATEEHGAKFFANGARVGGVLTIEENLGDEARKQLRESWQKAHGGNDNAYKIAVLGAAMKWQPMGMDSEKAQHLETRQFQVEETCRAFNVKPIVVGHSDKAATYASAEAMFTAHKVQTMDPWYALLEQSAGKNLLTVEDRRQGYYFRFLANGLLRSTAKERGEFYKSMFAVGAFSPNRILELEDENPYEGGEKHYYPTNMAPVEDQGQGDGNEQPQPPQPQPPGRDPGRS